MKNFIISLLLCIVIFPSLSFGQAEVKIMQYNLLNYGNYTYYCTSQNNSTANKNIYLKTILDYVQPDIFTVNEMRAYTTKADSILNGTLNVDGVTYYKRADVTGSYLANMLFYDSRKFKLVSQVAIGTSVRVVDVYTLYYLSPDVANNNDTVYLHCVVAHLKAGNGTTEAASRAEMTNTTMNYLRNNFQSGNFLFMGDFNLYTSSEEAYQNIINPSDQTIVFNDPINKPGDWNENSSFEAYHTQSTHYDFSNTCTAGGGMDDRFDFILISDEIKNNIMKISYKSGSYEAIGNDGDHYNSSVNYGTNNSVPSNIADALYNMSDHLPISLVLEINQTEVSGIDDMKKQDFHFSYTNPISNQLEISCENTKQQQNEVELNTNLGHVVYKETINTSTGNGSHIIPTTTHPDGLYLLKVSQNQKSIVKKIIKQ